MAEFLVILIVGGLLACGVLGAIDAVLRWTDRRDVDRLSEEWRRRARERREREENDSALEARRNG